MNDLKSKAGDVRKKVRSDVTFKSPKKILTDMLGALILVGTIYLGVRFGLVVGGVFFAIGLLFSMYAARKWNI